MNIFKSCELWFASSPESMAAWVLKKFGSCWNYIYFPPFLCLNLKGLNILCFPYCGFLLREVLYSLYHIYLCFCVITIGVRCAFRLLIHFRSSNTYGLQMDSRSSHLPMLSLLRKHHRHSFRPSYHRQIVLQKHLLSLISSLASVYPASFSRTIVHSRSCSCMRFLSMELQNKHLI